MYIIIRNNIDCFIVIVFNMVVVRSVKVEILINEVEEDELSILMGKWWKYYEEKKWEGY